MMTVSVETQSIILLSEHLNDIASASSLYSHLHRAVRVLSAEPAVSVFQKDRPNTIAKEAKEKEAEPVGLSRFSILFRKTTVVFSAGVFGGSSCLQL